MSTWLGNHNISLPGVSASAWIHHGRDIDVNDKWVATISIYAPGFDMVTVKTIYGVQDDFGNFVEVPHEFN